MASSDSTTFCVYRIVNFRTGKVYVGKTTNFKTRKYAHFYDLKHNKHHSNYLQNAYNKYGKDAFYIELLEDGIGESNLNARETYWIAHFDSFHNGYNETEGGEGKCGLGNTCEWNGTVYPTIRAAARALGINQTSMRERLLNGYTCNEDMPGHAFNNAKPCTWNGVVYKSVAEAARVIGVNQSVLASRIRRGLVCDDDIKNQPQQTTWNGVKYNSISSCARANNVSSSTMEMRIKKGYACDSDLKKRYGQGDSCVWNGIRYKSITDCAIANGIAASSMAYRIKQGYTCEADMKHKRR